MWYKSDEKMDKPTIYRKPMGESLFEEEFTARVSTWMPSTSARKD